VARRAGDRRGHRVDHHRRGRGRGGQGTAEILR
jgi:hypothetical protein